MTTTDYNQKISRTQTIFFISIVVLFSVWLGWPSEQTAQPPRKEFDFETTEFKLLTLDKGHPMSISDPDIPKVGKLLDALSKQYQMPRDKIADITYAAKKDLINSGIKNASIVTMLSDLEGISRGKEPSFLKDSYSTVMAMYLVEVEKKR